MRIVHYSNEHATEGYGKGASVGPHSTRHLIKVVSKFRQRAISEAALFRDVDHWQVMSKYDTIGPFFKKHCLQVSEEKPEIWATGRLYRFYDEYWEATNTMKRKLPTGINFPRFSGQEARP